MTRPSNERGVSEHPSPISEGEIERAVAAARRIVDRESCHYTLLATTNVEEVILIARALLSQRCGRDEALEEARKAAVAECKKWDKNMGGTDGGNIAHYIDKAIRSLRSVKGEG